MKTAKLKTFDIVAHLTRQHEFSIKTFGPGPRTEGVMDHITKEVAEVRAAPKDVKEWIDLLILSCDGAMRRGFRPTDVASRWTDDALPMDTVQNGDFIGAFQVAQLATVMDPDNLDNWTQMIRLASCGALHTGISPLEWTIAWVAKQEKNEARTWPDWRTADPNKAIEHVRGSND